MRYLKCTKKVLDEMGVKPVAITERPDEGGPLGDWCVNLLRINRKKCLLFISLALNPTVRRLMNIPNRRPKCILSSDI